ncbi:MAG: hypothetical protein U0835_17195 [Isosphaeraceae bacterium]
MLIFRGGSWPEHRTWFLITVGVTAASIGWYAFEAARTGTLPGGSSPPGLVFGVVGGFLMLFEMLLYVRKKLRVWRIGRAKLWMKAHIWVGFIVVPLFVLHSGFRWTSGPLSSVLMFSFLGVIVSGIWGLALQQSLPKLMLDTVPAETIRSQIDRVRGLMLEEARRIVNVTCGREELVPAGASAEDESRNKTYIVVGAVRETGSLQGKFLSTQARAVYVPGCELLAKFFDETVVPYLSARSGRGFALGSERRSAQIFRDLKNRLDPAAHVVVDALAETCDQRRQFDRQALIHGWLHAWLLVHLPLSVGMFVLMLIHTYYALRFM